jgi:hypothetical protein
MAVCLVLQFAGIDNSKYEAVMDKRVDVGGVNGHADAADASPSPLTVEPHALGRWRGRTDGGLWRIDLHWACRTKPPAD